VHNDGIHLAANRLQGGRVEGRPVPTDISDDEWAEACRYDQVVRDLLDRAEGGQIGRAAVANAAAVLGISSATLYRLIGRFRKERRVSALLPRKCGRRPGTQVISDEVETIIQEAIREVYLVPERPTLQELIRVVTARCRVRGQRPPVAETVTTRVRRIDAERRAKLRQDVRSVEAMRATPGGLNVEQPLQLVQIDHTLTDVVVVDEETRQFVGRPWLTLGIDVFTRMVTGRRSCLQQ
jgi:putative transposase